ncbi:unnamed protein product [Orchesella dallaii]|uniref:Uracil-DNA glycosylase n=1 Tax=Orchesella dallaii TaxID=48710 RepID=A0ABP1R8V2_9HEXA
MVHPFFRRVGIKPELADYFASPVPVELKFSRVFSILFPKRRFFDEEVTSWLDAIANQFHFPSYETKVSQFLIGQVESLFSKLGMYYDMPVNSSVFQFWVYLTWFYRKLVRKNYKRDDNIFGFMRGFPINYTSVVIMGNDPAKCFPSSGYAFHGSACASTRHMLELMNNEMGILSDHFQNDVWKLTRRDLDGAKGNTNLHGWIKQGILLLNSAVAYFGEGPIVEAWGIFIDFVLAYLSHFKRNMVFIFLGGIVAEKKNWIDEKNHFVMELYHPFVYSSPPTQPLDRKLDWSTVLPFLNANFYIFQTLGEEAMIDWISVGWYKKGTHYRATSLGRFFDFVMQCYKVGTAGWGQVRTGLKVTRNKHGLLLLEKDFKTSCK